MKAITYTKYSSADVLHFKEVEKPVPKEGEVLVKIYATTVNRTDSATIRVIPFFARIVTGLFKPKKQIPGTEFSGNIKALGKTVSSFDQGYMAQNIFLPLITPVIKPLIANKKNNISCSCKY